MAKERTARETAEELLRRASQFVARESPAGAEGVTALETRSQAALNRALDRIGTTAFDAAEGQKGAVRRLDRQLRQFAGAIEDRAPSSVKGLRSAIKQARVAAVALAREALSPPAAGPIGGVTRGGRAVSIGAREVGLTAGGGLQKALQKETSGTLARAVSAQAAEAGVAGRIAAIAKPASRFLRGAGLFGAGLLAFDVAGSVGQRRRENRQLGEILDEAQRPRGPGAAEQTVQTIRSIASLGPTALAALQGDPALATALQGKIQSEAAGAVSFGVPGEIGLSRRGAAGRQLNFQSLFSR